ncbi:unnamed protein product, partial [Iphiclides podalirius]
MAAKILNKQKKINREVRVSENNPDSQVHYQNRSRRTRHHNNDAELFSNCNIFMRSDVEKDIVIWICTLNNNNKHLYGIKVAHEYDLSYSYTGEGLHIQNIQDPMNIVRMEEFAFV